MRTAYTMGFMPDVPTPPQPNEAAPEAALRAPWPLSLAASFLPAAQPWIARHSYRHEVVTALTFPVAIALIEGATVSVLAKKTFDVPDWGFAVIMAAPFFANITSFFWAWITRGLPKVRLMVAIQLAVLACVAAIAVLPTTWLGAVILVGLVVVARCLMAGIVTLRSTMWRNNYPRHLRAKVTSNLAFIATMILAISPLLGYLALDFSDQAFRVVYPVSVVLALIGVVAFSRIRIRRERELLRYELQSSSKPTKHGGAGGVYEFDPADDKSSFFKILKRDPDYRNYLTCQFVLGCGNMMGEVVTIYLVAALTEGMPFEYVTSIVLVTAVPMLLAMASMRPWARYLDSVHIVRFRRIHGLFFIGSHALGWVAFASGLGLFATLGLLMIARVTQGLARGGGLLAWQLGHNDFADRRFAAAYMGVHVTLTGVRGAIAPFLGVMLATGWASVALPFTSLSLPGFAGLEEHVLLVAVGAAMTGHAGFLLMHHRMNKAGRMRVADD